MIRTYGALDLSIIYAWIGIWLCLGLLGWLAVVRCLAGKRKMVLEDWLMAVPCALLGPVSIFLAMRRWG